MSKQLTIVRIQKLFAAFTLLIFSFSIPFTVYAADTENCRASACFVSTTSLGEANISMVKATLFEYYFFDLYSIALYAPEAAADAEKVLGNVPKKLVFHYHRDIERQDFIEAADQVLKKNPNVDMKVIEERLAELNSWYVSVEEDDIYELSYVPEKGTSLALNGKELGTVPGVDFQRAYFGIWLSNHSISDSLRNRLVKKKKRS